MTVLAAVLKKKNFQIIREHKGVRVGVGGIMKMIVFTGFRNRFPS